MTKTTRTLGPMLALALSGCADLPADHVAAARVSQGGSAPAVRQSTNFMTPGLARIALRDTLQRRHLYNRATVMPDLFVEARPGTSYYDTKNLRVTSQTLSFDYDEDAMVFQSFTLTPTPEPKRRTNRVAHRFAAETPCTGVRELADSRTRFYSPLVRAAEGLYAWQDFRDAQLFCDAWNQLVDQSRRGESDDMLVFTAEARQWREKPESRSPAPAGWERHRVLAESSYRERDLMGALQHYEAGLRIRPMWPEGWFNAALLYEVLGEYEYASNRMRRYLALVPNAPDARAARDKLIVWEEKIRGQ